MTKYKLKRLSARKWLVVRNGRKIYSGPFKYAAAIVNRHCY